MSRAPTGACRGLARGVRAVLPVAVLSLLAACPAPIAREVHVTFSLQPDRVEMQGAFNDLRVQHDDPLLSFRELLAIATADEAARLVQLDGGWSPRRYAFVERDGGLDLRIEATLARAHFERCVTACTKTEEPACDWLPVRRCAGDYQLFVTQLVNVYDFAPGVAQRAPADAGTLRYALVAKPGRLETPSALAAWRLFQSDPVEAQRLAAWMNAADASFRAWFSETPPPLPARPQLASPALNTLAETFLQRHRHRLVYEALLDSNVVTTEPPEAEPGMLRVGERSSVLARPLPSPVVRAFTEAAALFPKDPGRAQAVLTKACGGNPRGELGALCLLLSPRPPVSRPARE